MPPTDAHLTKDYGLVIAAHGSSRRPEANAYVNELADQIAGSGDFAWVETIFAVDDGGFAVPKWPARGIIIVPFFMSDGGLAEKLTAEIVGGIAEHGEDLKVLKADPIGSRPEIADHAMDLALSTLQPTPYPPEETALVLVAHGSGVRPDSRNDALKQVVAIKSSRRFAETKLALLEEPPSLQEVLLELNKPAVVVGLFAAPGGHATDDVATEIAAAGKKDVYNAGPVGLHAGFGDLIAAVAQQTIAESGS